MAVFLPMLLLCIAHSVRGAEALQCDQKGHVCGTDGRTYKSICHLKRAKVEDPDLQVLYTDRCFKGLKLSSAIEETTTESAGHTLAPGRELRCTLIGQPVCGSDGKTYPNKCFLTYANLHDFPNLALKHHGPCKKVDEDESQSQEVKKRLIGFKKHSRSRKKNGHKSEIHIDLKNDAKNYN